MTLTIGNDRKTKKPGRNARHSFISKSKSKNNIIKGKALIPPAVISAFYSVSTYTLIKGSNEELQNFNNGETYKSANKGEKNEH